MLIELTPSGRHAAATIRLAITGIEQRALAPLPAEPDVAPFPWQDAATQHCGQKEIQPARPTPADAPAERAATDRPDWRPAVRH